MPQPKKILILGAGFAGVQVMSNLRRSLNQPADIVLVNETNYFLFTPLLHEVATGGLFPENVTMPLRPLAKKCGTKFIQARIKLINLNKKSVLTTAGSLDYDYLVMALGGTTNFYQVPGAEKHSLTLKDLPDTLAIKSRIVQAFEEASVLSPADRVGLLTFTIVGGGPTGVGLAAEISDFILDAFKPYYPARLLAEAKIIILQKDNYILPQFSTQLRSRCLEELVKKGVAVRLNEAVTTISASDVTLMSGEVINSRNVIWTAGIKPNEVKMSPSPEAVKGRLKVDQFFRLPEFPEVYVLGDLAYFEQDGQSLPMLAQVAHKAGKNVAANLGRVLAGWLPVPFKYRHAGTLISLGSWWAAGEIGFAHFHGRFAWWLWRTIYLSKMPTWSKKLQIALDWTIDLFTARDLSIWPKSNKK